MIPPLNCEGGFACALFSYVNPEERIPSLSSAARKVRQIVNALSALDAEFAKLYAADGHPSIAPE